MQRTQLVYNKFEVCYGGPPSPRQAWLRRVKGGENMPNIDQKKLIQAAIIVAAFGIFILSLTYVIPLLGILGAVAIIAAGIYAIYLFLTGKLKL